MIIANISIVLLLSVGAAAPPAALAATPCERARVLQIDSGYYAPAKREDGLSTRRLTDFVTRCLSTRSPKARYSLAVGAQGEVMGRLYELEWGTELFSTPRATDAAAPTEQAKLDAAIDKMLLFLIELAEAHAAKAPERAAAAEETRQALAKAGVVLSVAEPKSVWLQLDFVERLQRRGVIVVVAATGGDEKAAARARGLRHVLTVDASAKPAGDPSTRAMKSYVLSVYAKLVTVDGVVLSQTTSNTNAIGISDENAAKGNVSNTQAGAKRPAWVVADAVAAALLEDVVPR